MHSLGVAWFIRLDNLLGTQMGPSHLGQAGSKEDALKHVTHSSQKLVHMGPLQHIHLVGEKGGCYEGHGKISLKY